MSQKSSRDSRSSRSAVSHTPMAATAQTSAAALSAQESSVSGSANQTPATTNRDAQMDRPRRSNESCVAASALVARPRLCMSDSLRGSRAT